MELINNEYIIVEIIPTALTPEKGDIVQLSAIKVDGLKIISRFDYRLDEDKIYIPDFKDMISYDKQDFIYKETTKEILEDFNVWSEDITLLILNNSYTYNFLKEIPNKKEFISVVNIAVKNRKDKIEVIILLTIVILLFVLLLSI